VIVGNIKPIKNQLFALEIAKAVNSHLTIIGKNQDEIYAKKIKETLSQTSSTWLENENDVSRLLGKFRLGIYCSLSESGPLVILEYLLCGLPFVAYKSGGIAEVICRYFPEFFLDNFDVNEWTERINYIVNTGGQIDSEKVGMMLQNEFNPVTYRNRLLALYECE
jgi:glycosyltransferase involved in cell wall biosynthesis